MKNILKITLYILMGISSFFLIVFGIFYINKVNQSNNNMSLLLPRAQDIIIEGVRFRDLNKNGKLDIYEDNRQSIEDRVDDLLSQMTIEEKAGSMFINIIKMNPKGDLLEVPTFFNNYIDILMSIFLPSNSDMIIQKKMNSFNIMEKYSANILGKYNNEIQKIAEKTRLGIPITVASDPRHGNSNEQNNSNGPTVYTESFSKWPNTLGLAATRDTLLVKKFGEIAREEYKSVGIRLALHPMADLATEPRWGRIYGTFGEDAKLSAEMTKAYVLGFQGEKLGFNSVACMTKHFSGGGPQEDGEDPHFYYGKNQVYPGNNFNYHLIPFIDGAFKANTAQIMPYYGIPVGQTSEDVAFGFNKDIITDLLRDSLKFDGVVCTDWSIVTDKLIMPPMSWGVEDLADIQKVKKIIDAGCDQIGGESIPEMIVDLVKSGNLTEERINISVKRLMKDKFTLGLFDNPFVELELISSIVGNKSFQKVADKANRKSIVMLKNKILPLNKQKKVFIEGFTLENSISDRYSIVEEISDSDIIIKKVQTPYDERNEFFLEAMIRQGRLYYNKKEIDRIDYLSSKKPLILVVNLERPAILTQIQKNADAVLVDFGSSNDALLDVIFGKFNPSGKLPFELPSSWEAVLNQKEDLPYDSKDPLYNYGHGLSYDLL
jgi:beta-glucosidase